MNPVCAVIGKMVLLSADLHSHGVFRETALGILQDTFPQGRDRAELIIGDEYDVTTVVPVWRRALAQEAACGAATAIPFPRSYYDSRH